MKWIAADITAFLDAMGQTVTLDNGSIHGTEITGIFSEPYETVNQFDGGLEMSDPYIDCATTDVTDAEHNQALQVNDKDYLINGVQNAGTGWTRLFLRERFD